jgi:hypothetical protein
VEADLKASEDVTRALRHQLETARTGGGGTSQAAAAALAAGLQSSGGGGGSGGRLTLKQRQEALRAKQVEAKRAAADALAAKGKAGSGGSSGDELPEYLKHLSKPQKKKYTELVAAERSLAAAAEDGKWKVKELEERCELAEEDASEQAALVASAEAALAAAAEVAAGLEQQVERLQGVAERHGKALGVMEVKDARLLWFEGEVRKQRDELLSVAAVRGAAEDLKQWLDDERAAHDKHAQSLHTLVAHLQTQAHAHADPHAGHATRAGNALEKQQRAQHEELQEQRVAAGKARERELVAWRKKQHALVADLVRSFVLELACDVALACEGATATTTYGFKPPSASGDGTGASGGRAGEEAAPFRRAGFQLSVVTEVRPPPPIEKEPPIQTKKRGSWLCGASPIKAAPSAPKLQAGPAPIREKPGAFRAPQGFATGAPLAPLHIPSGMAFQGRTPGTAI